MAKQYTYMIWWAMAGLALPASCYDPFMHPSHCTRPITDRILTPNFLEFDDYTLMLHDCNITIIQNGAFNKVSCDTLDLANNKIHHIEAGAFDSIGILSSLYLTNNSILGESLDPEIFRNAESLDRLFLSLNNMASAPDDLLQGTRISLLELNNCSLYEVPTFARDLKKLEHLSLAKNHLEKLNDPNLFSLLPELSKLDLSRNKIDILHVDLFRANLKLKYLYLQHNKLRYLPEGLLQNLSSLNVVNLRDNYLTTVSANAFSGTHLKILTLSHNRITNLTENFFTQLKETTLDWPLKVNINFNPWMCACLNEVLKEVKTLGVRDVDKDEDKSEEDGGTKRRQVVENIVEDKGRAQLCLRGEDKVCRREGNNEGIIRVYEDMMMIPHMSGNVCE